MNRSFVLVLAALTALLAGCASTRVVDSEVKSFAQTPAPAKGQTYRYERLPSQQASADAQTRLEALADAALARAGLLRRDDAARYSVQISVSSVLARGDAHDPYGFASFGYGWRPYYRLGFGYGYGPAYWRYPGHSHFAAPYSAHRHDLTLVLRDLGSQQIAYETRASHEGVSTDLPALLPALLEAALKDFPNPPQGARQVRVELPR